MTTLSPGLKRAALVCLAAILATAGCMKKPPAMPTGGPVEVKAVTVAPSETVMYTDKVGEVKGSQEVQIRSRVSGILLAKHFDDGALVKEGDRLFSIDPREYLAQVASAQANVAAAQADLVRANEDVSRYGPLLKDEAISQQVYDNAVAVAKQSAAQVSASKAALDQAQLGVEYAEIRAPIHGRIGMAQVFPGDLISAGQTLMATVSSDDPAWVYFNISEAELLKAFAQNSGKEPAADDPARIVQLILSNGEVYPIPGKINFGDRALDPTTGTYKLRADFPNPEHRLIPGLFGRVRLTRGTAVNAIVVPDRAVQEQLGKFFLTVVGPEDKAEMRPVQLGPRFGNRQVIESGLKAGDKVVVEGLQKARPGSTLKVVEVKLEDFDRKDTTTPPPPSAPPQAAGAAK